LTRRLRRNAGRARRPGRWATAIHTTGGAVTPTAAVTGVTVTAFTVTAVTVTAVYPNLRAGPRPFLCARTPRRGPCSGSRLARSKGDVDWRWVGVTVADSIRRRFAMRLQERSACLVSVLRVGGTNGNQKCWKTHKACLAENIDVCIVCVKQRRAGC
jgi:hypothetical protein